ncbi:MAG: cell division protein FtsQ/DivIB [Bdellovibrionota bacterium]
MRKVYKVIAILFLILLVNSLIFLFFYLKNKIVVSVKLDGNKFTSTNKIFKQFKIKTDVFYWYLNKSKIETKIEKLPFVKEVSIYPDSLKQFYRLNIVIKEEEPFYLVKLKSGGTQIISKDGKMLTYINNGNINNDNINNNKVFLDNREFFYSLPVIVGLDDKFDSSQTLNSRYIYMANFLKKISKSTFYTVRSIVFSTSGEINISFFELKPQVVLDLSKNDAWVDVQLERLNALIKELGSNINNVEKLDLGYSKVGVIKFNQKGKE